MNGSISICRACSMSCNAGNSQRSCTMAARSTDSSAGADAAGSSCQWLAGNSRFPPSVTAVAGITNPATGNPPAATTTAVVAGCAALPAGGFCPGQRRHPSAASRAATATGGTADGTPAAAVRTRKNSSYLPTPAAMKRPRYRHWSGWWRTSAVCSVSTHRPVT